MSQAQIETVLNAFKSGVHVSVILAQLMNDVKLDLAPATKKTMILDILSKAAKDAEVVISEQDLNAYYDVYADISNGKFSFATLLKFADDSDLPEAIESAIINSDSKCVCIPWLQSLLKKFKKSPKPEPEVIAEKP